MNTPSSSKSHPVGHLLAVFTLLLVSACSNSSIFINPVYNRLDNQIMKSFENLTEFDAAQTAEFKIITDNFHYWHRRNELPSYAALLADVQKSVRVNSTTLEEVASWLERTEAMSQAFRACHPVNFSYDIIRSVTDEQLAAIREKRTARSQKYREKYLAETTKQRLDRRAGNILKWTSRTGLVLDPKQERILRETLAKQISLRKQFYVLSDKWNAELYAILDDRSSPELDARMGAHLQKLWHLLEDAYPQEWQQNRDLWASFLLRLVQSFSIEQRTHTSRWIRTMGRTLKKVAARSAPDPVFADSMGCARPPSASG